jgi:hypothetical protein
MNEETAKSISERWAYGWDSERERDQQKIGGRRDALTAALATAIPGAVETWGLAESQLEDYSAVDGPEMVLLDEVAEPNGMGISAGLSRPKSAVVLQQTCGHSGNSAK